LTHSTATTAIPASEKKAEDKIRFSIGDDLLPWNNQMRAALQQALSHHHSCCVKLSALSHHLRNPLLVRSSTGSSSSTSSSGCQQAPPSVHTAWSSSSRAYSSQRSTPQHHTTADPFGPLPALQQRRVLVTGIGMVTPLGVGVQDSWQGLIAGRTGVRRLQADDLPEVYHAECCPCGCI
jgi:hypothetical protein